MRVKLLTLRYSSTLGVIDDTPLQEFTRDKEVLTLRDHFFSVNDVPHLACIVSYQEPQIPAELLEQAKQFQSTNGAPSGATSSRGRYAQDRPDPAAGLGEADRLLFNTIRQWRSRKCREEGAPPYIILTNRQLLDIVARKPDSLTALSQINGIGKAKVERYGRELLALVAAGRVGTRPASEPVTETTTGGAR